MTWLLALLLLAATATAQEQPIEHAPPYLSDCYLGCPPMEGKSVMCLDYSKAALPPVERGVRCVGYCMYEGQPYFAPRGEGWTACFSAAGPGLACNASIYRLPPTLSPFGRVINPTPCDHGSADYTAWP